MLAEIYILRLEATVRANAEESTFAPKFVPLDRTTVPDFKKSAPHPRTVRSIDVGYFPPNTPRTFLR
jgi:hypothetical protein